MFGFSLATQLFQGSAQRTWNCVTQFTNLIWHKFNHIRYPAMPRSRRRHHSRSRSRSRSHSHDRDREVKRRKIDSVESPAHKRSVSCEPHSSTARDEDVKIVVKHVDNNDLGQESHAIKPDNMKEKIFESDVKQEGSSDLAADVNQVNNEANKDGKVITSSEIEDKTKLNALQNLTISDTEKSFSTNIITKQQLEEKMVMITPKKTMMSPKQIQKKLESEQKRKQKQLEREEREKKKLVEKEKLKQEKEKQKRLKEEAKRKEREEKEEQKRKEREEKEAKRKEKEEREEQKRKERELEKLRKQQEIEEKNKEKQKQEEQKQKAAAAFVNYFVSKKPETTKMEEEDCSTKLFMPFPVKSDMRLAPLTRRILNEEEKKFLTHLLTEPDDKASYLSDLKAGGKPVGKSNKTWPPEDDDVILVEEDVGESICEDKSQGGKMRAKFLLFHENKRPPYYGTWRKKSTLVRGSRPFAEDKVNFNYELDSDDDWEEEEQGESLDVSDEDDKENAEENDEYEVDNDFFVPHGHLSEDEIDDEATAKLSPESHKEKLKLLKDEFDEDMKTKTNRMKPRSIGCIWYNKDGSNVDEAIDRHLRPLAMITNGPIIIRKMKKKDLIMHSSTTTPTRKHSNLQQELIPAFLKLIHGNAKKGTVVIEDFIVYMQNNGYEVEVSKTYLHKKLREFAQWKKCPKLNKFCWCVEDEVKKKYNFDLSTI